MCVGAISRGNVEAQHLLMHANDRVNREHMQHENMGGDGAGRAHTNDRETIHDEWCQSHPWLGSIQAASGSAVFFGLEQVDRLFVHQVQDSGGRIGGQLFDAHRLPNF